MLCEIIDRYINVTFAEIQLKKENLKRVFCVPEYRHPNRYTGLPNSLDVSLAIISIVKPINSVHSKILSANQVSEFFDQQICKRIGESFRQTFQKRKVGDKFFLRKLMVTSYFCHGNRHSRKEEIDR